MAGGKVRILKPVKAHENIAPRGSEAKAGNLVLTAGHRVGPAEIAVMATFGYSEVKVYVETHRSHSCYGR